jgi:imidazolonepropionase-like amidohydrolase/Tol biopolymer transport system component
MRHTIKLNTCFFVTLLYSTTAFSADGNTDWDPVQPPFSSQSYSANIDVSEGTWMSLDVSPDGSTIAFDLLGDIYTIPMTGGNASNVTAGFAWDMQPRFSPDGSMLAFTSDRSGGDNIWVIELDTGATRQITFEDFRLLNNPTWSPDGQYLAARKHFTTSRSLGTGEIWMYHIDGGTGQQGQQVVERPNPSFQKELGEPMFTADGSGIYYSQNTTPGNTFIYHQDSNTELFQIRRVTLATGEIDTVAGGAGGAVRPAPSPDGTRLAYVKRVRAQSRLFVMDLATGEERMIFDSLDPDMQETWAVHGLYPNMDWTPDSQSIVFWAQGKIWSIDVASGEVTEIPFRVEDTRTLQPPLKFKVDVAPNEFDTKMVRFASRSPDGESIVFESLGRLYIKRGDDQPEQLHSDSTDGFDYFPVWSTDSRNVYFLRWHDQDLTTLHRVRSRGGRSQTLELTKGQYTELAISSDGETLTFRKRGGNNLLHPNHDLNPGLYVYDIDSETASFVSERGLSPHFGPDGRLYAQERAESATGRGSATAKTMLISMTLGGNDVREIAVADFATAIRLSPTGEHIAFVDGYHVFIAAARFSGKPLVLDAGRPAFPTAKLSSIGGEFMTWSADGSEVSWSTGPDFKTVSVESALAEDFEPPSSGINLSIRVMAEVPDTEIALTNARIITMNDSRDVIENGTILIRGNRIESLGEADSVAIPAGYQTINLAGKTLTPGFVDIHAHGPYGSGKIVPQQNWNLLAHLALGVTTVHNPSSQAALAFAAAEYQRANQILGPRIFSTGEIVYGAKSTNWAPIDNLNDALAHIRRLKAQGAISVKNYNQPRRDQRQQVIEAAYREGMMSVAEGGALFHMDMNLIADGISGIEHNVPTLKMYDDVTQYWRQSGAGYTPTLVVTFGGLTSEDYFYQHTEVWKHPILSNFVPPSVLQPRSIRRLAAPDEDFRDNAAAAAAKILLDEGIMVNTGAHGQREGLGTHWEMWSFGRGGFSPMEALSAATINPAKYMAMDGDIGSLEVGKLADMVIMNANPLDNIRNTDQISHVMVNGHIYEAGTLKEEFTGEAELKDFYWKGKPESAIR